MPASTPLRAAISRFPLASDVLSLADVNGPHNAVRLAWDRLHGLPGGKALFSKLIGRAAPYTGSIRAVVEELHVGHAKVALRDRPELRNHLDCVHAITLANLAEMTGNVALAYGLPDEARFIVAGMDLEYVKKARGRIHATSDFEPILRSETANYDIPVVMRDAAGEVVTRATLRTKVGPKKGR